MALTTIKITQDDAGNPVVVEEQPNSTYLEKTTLLPGRLVASGIVSLTNTTDIFTFESFNNDVEGGSRIMIIAKATQAFKVGDIYLELFDSQEDIIYAFSDSPWVTIGLFTPMDTSKSSQYTYGRVLAYSELPVSIADTKITFQADSESATPFDVTVNIYVLYPVPSVTTEMVLPVKIVPAA